MSGLTVARDVALLFASLEIAFSLPADGKRILQDQTAALQQIAENTKAPVAIKLDGFSPEAQTALATALTPEKSKLKAIKK